MVRPKQVKRKSYRKVARQALKSPYLPKSARSKAEQIANLILALETLQKEEEHNARMMDDKEELTPECPRSPGYSPPSPGYPQCPSSPGYSPPQSPQYSPTSPPTQSLNDDDDDGDDDIGDVEGVDDVLSFVI